MTVVLGAIAILALAWGLAGVAEWWQTRQLDRAGILTGLEEAEQALKLARHTIEEAELLTTIRALRGDARSVLLIPDSLALDEEALHQAALETGRLVITGPAEQLDQIRGCERCDPDFIHEVEA